MTRLSNNVTGTLHFLAFLLSIPLLSAGIWLAAIADTYCERFLQWPVLCIGASLTLVSLLGFVAACFRVTWMLWIYYALMFLLIILLFCFTVFAFVVTKKKGGGEEYMLGDYSNWLQKRVENANNWRRISRCIEDAKICNKLVPEKAEQFNKRKLAPVQSGCCMPPTSCGFDPNNATYWTPPGQTNATWNRDCKRWSKDPEKLCYDCDACRAGVAANVKHKWQKIVVADVAVLVALVVVYSIASCCALQRSPGEYDRFGPRRHP